MHQTPASKPGSRVREKTSRVLDRLRTTDDRDLDYISDRSLQWPGLEQAEARIGMVMLVPELKMGLVEYFRLEFHPSVIGSPPPRVLSESNWYDKDPNRDDRLANATLESRNHADINVFHDTGAPTPIRFFLTPDCGALTLA